MDMSPDQLAHATGGRWLAPPTDLIATGVSIDSREDLEGRVFVAIRGERHDGHDFVGAAGQEGAVAAIVERVPALPTAPVAATASPAPTAASSSLGTTMPTLLVHSTRRALADLARATRAQFTGRAAAITGSCGKTTTRRMLAAILGQGGPTVQSPKSFNNDLGVPLTMLALRAHHRHLVSEIGMNHAGEIEPLVRLVRPHVAVITMVGHAHIEALGSVEAIAREKASIVAGLEPGGTVIFPSEQPLIAEAVDEALERHGLASSIRRMTFGHQRGDGRLLLREPTDAGSEIEIGGPWGMVHIRLAMPGAHNAMNALAAALAAHALGALPDAIREGLAAVRPAEMRSERERIGPFTVHNDAYNANPEAMRAAVTAFVEAERAARRRVTVLGDMLELGEASDALHAELGRWLAAADSGAPPDLAVFVGVRAATAAKALAHAAPGATVLVLPDASAASAARLQSMLEPGDAILVKASRGAALERLVHALASSVAANAPGAAAASAGAPRA